MFGKKCPNCDEKIKKDYNYCPFCKTNLRSTHDSEDYGFLGKDDVLEEPTMTNSFTDNLMEKMFNSAMKMLEKQMKNINVESKHQPRHNFPGLNVQFFVNGERVFPENQQPMKKRVHMSRDKMKRFSELPKKEPQSKIKRLSNKIVYELIVPGVKEINDVLINQLENSIEVKALSDNVVYSKNLNVNLPILKYQLVRDSLFIEMQAR